jgi:hypothetical protein
MVSTRGLELLTHTAHPGRQLSIPVDLRYDDWEELCDRMLEKVAEMTGRDNRYLARSVFDPVGGSSTKAPPYRLGLRRAGQILVLLVSLGAAAYAGYVLRAPAPISISLAGCMDRNAARSVGMMAYDAHARFTGEVDGVNNFLWTRHRALQAATYAEEMRRCYLEAQLMSQDFDHGGRIAADMDRIDTSIRSIYTGIGASLLPGAKADGSREAAEANFRSAEDAATRISTRLGQLVGDMYF